MELDNALKSKVATYQPPQSVVDLLSTTPILLLVAISGGGKDTIKRLLLATGKYHHIISYTTRAPRSDDGVMEKDGLDYHFIDYDAANHMLDAGEYIEADVYADNLYGTGISDIVAAKTEHKIATTDMTIEGALHYLELAPPVKAVFLLPPSYEVWIQRLVSRYDGHTLNPDDMRLRLQEAVEEISGAIAADNMYIVVNDDLDKTVQLVDDIAHDKAVEPHYHKALEIAQHLLDRLEEELSKPTSR